MSIVDLQTDVPPGTVVVVIDVIRAFTTAAVAFDRGAAGIACVSTVEDGRELRRRHPDRLLIGEAGGLPPADFDLGNSPFEMSTAPVAGRHLIQATSNGTRGLLRHPRPAALLAASAPTVGATARWIAAHHPHTPYALVCTGETAEDRACAVHLDALLRGGAPCRDELVAGITAGAAAHDAGYLARDLPFCCDVDRFPFALVGTVRPGHVALEAVTSP